jgi:hypothetical protein
VLRVVLTLDQHDRPPLRGAIVEPDGTRWPFVGVLELVAVIERLLERGPGSAS